MSKYTVPLLLTLTFFCTSNSLIAQNWFERIKENTKQILDKTKEVTKQTIGNSKNKRENITNDLSYPVQHFDLKNLKEINENGKKYLRKSAINGIKNIPVRDQYSGRTITFNEHCRNTIIQVGGCGLQGSDIAEEPVETAILIMMDNNQLYDAKIIKNRQGNWTSIKEASIGGTHGDIVAEFWNMKKAYERYDYVGFSNGFISMMNKVERVNK